MFAQIEKYYGEYENKELKKMVNAYLIKDHKQDQFKSVLKSILYYHPAKYKAPCIASIEECLKKARIEKGLTDTHKSKMETDTSSMNYLEQKKNMNETEQKEVTGKFKDLMKDLADKRKTV
jgi:hypothetical protein